MKKAKDYINISNLSFKSKTLQIGIIEEWIKAAQIDAINTSVKRCADNAEADYIILDSFDPVTGEDIEAYIIKSSILQVAEELKKELECDQ